MEQEFGKSGDQSAGEPTTFDTSDTTTDTITLGSITAEDLAALRLRDENAQPHIVTIESENESLRTQVTDLQNSLSSATTLEEVMNRMNVSDGETQTQADPDTVADKVEQRLQLRTQQRVQDDNWNDVYDKLTETYGDWNKANQEIELRCASLKMTTQEATSLAKTSPDAFNELFLPKAGTPMQSSAASATGTQTSIAPVDGTARDKAYYKELRKKNPNKYWSAETQAQYRRDLHGAQ